MIYGFPTLEKEWGFLFQPYPKHLHYTFCVCSGIKKWIHTRMQEETVHTNVVHFKNKILINKDW